MYRGGGGGKVTIYIIDTVNLFLFLTFFTMWQ